MPLTRTEQRRLTELVEAHIVGTADPYPALQAVLGRYALTLRLNGAPRTNARIVVNTCVDAGLSGSGNPPILRLLEEMIELGHPVQSMYDKLVGEYEISREAEPEDPFRVQLLYGRQAFLDRKVLRKVLKELTLEHGPCVLTVSGPRKSGKSYSRYLIQHLAEKYGFRYVFAELDKLLMPRDVLLDLATSISPDLRLEPPEGNEELTKWMLHTVHRILAKAAQLEEGRWWFVLDGGAKEHLPIVIYDLIALIVDEILRTGRRWMRLVLLDYDRPFHDDLKPHWRRESIEAIGRSHVYDFLTEYFQSRPTILRAVQSPHAVIERMTDDLFKHADKKCSGHQSDFLLPYLNKAVHEAIHEFQEA